jgi:hypothetical protein
MLPQQPGQQTQLPGQRPQLGWEIDWLSPPSTLQKNSKLVLQLSAPDAGKRTVYY